MRHQKGFTLVELLVTLGLAGIIMSLVMSFFIMNIKNYEAINIQSELQYQSQYIINFMTNKILEAEKINTVNYNPDESGEKTDIEEISFNHGLDVFAFVINGDKDMKFVESSSVPTTETDLGKNVKLNVKPIPNGDFKDANGLEIELILKKGKQEFPIKQTVYMRNK